MDALRYEAGGRVRGVLTKWLSRNPDASPSDRLVAQSLLSDLTDAIGGGGGGE